MSCRKDLNFQSKLGPHLDFSLHKKIVPPRVFYSFLHVWWRGIIKNLGFSPNRRKNNFHQTIWLRKNLGFTHSRASGQSVDSICFLAAVARLSSTAMLKARRPCGTEAPELMFLIFLVFFAIRFSRFGKPSRSRIWIRFDLENSWGFLWIIGFHGGKFQFKLKSLRSRWFQETPIWNEFLLANMPKRMRTNLEKTPIKLVSLLKVGMKSTYWTFMSYQASSDVRATNKLSHSQIQSWQSQHCQSLRTPFATDKIIVSFPFLL